MPVWFLSFLVCSFLAWTRDLVPTSALWRRRGTSLSKKVPVKFRGSSKEWLKVKEEMVQKKSHRPRVSGFVAIYIHIWCKNILQARDAIMMLASWTSHITTRVECNIVSIIIIIMCVFVSMCERQRMGRRDRKQQNQKDDYMCVGMKLLCPVASLLLPSYIFCLPGMPDKWL